MSGIFAQSILSCVDIPCVYKFPCGAYVGTFGILSSHTLVAGEIHRSQWLQGKYQVSLLLKGDYIEVVYTTILRHVSADAVHTSKDYSTIWCNVIEGGYFQNSRRYILCLLSLISQSSGPLRT